MQPRLTQFVPAPNLLQAPVVWPVKVNLTELVRMIPFFSQTWKTSFFVQVTVVSTFC